MIEPLLEDTSEVLSLISELVYQVTEPEDQNRLRELERQLSGQVAMVSSAEQLSGTPYDMARAAAETAKQTMIGVFKNSEADQRERVEMTIKSVTPLMDSLSRLLVSV